MTTKFNIHQEVWTIGKDGYPKTVKVIGISIATSRVIDYDLLDGDKRLVREENLIGKTKEDLKTKIFNL